MYRLVVATVAVDVWDDSGALSASIMGAWSTESLELTADDVLAHVRGTLGATWQQASLDSIRASILLRSRPQQWEQLELFR